MAEEQTSRIHRVHLAILSIGKLIIDRALSSWYFFSFLFTRNHLAKLDKKGTTALMFALRGWAGSETQIRAAIELGRRGDPRAVQPLSACLDYASSELRRSATLSLGQIKDPRAFEPIRRMLGDPDANVRSGAVDALGLLGDSRAIRILQDLLLGFGDLNSFRVIEALGRFHQDEARDALMNAAKYASAGLRAAAVEQLGENFPQSEVSEFLRSVANHDADWKPYRTAVVALTKRGMARNELPYRECKHSSEFVTEGNRKRCPDCGYSYIYTTGGVVHRW